MEESTGVQPRISVCRAPDTAHSEPTPPTVPSSTRTPSNVAPVTNSPAAQTTGRPESEVDNQNTDRSGLAQRLVRKTKTNFLLSTTKKSRKSKAAAAAASQGDTAQSAAPDREGTSHHETKVPERSGPVKSKDRKRDKHAKTRDKPTAGSKSRTETDPNAKTRSSLRKKGDRVSKTTAASDGYPGSNKGPPTKPVFGVRLSVACERSPSHDGVPLPSFFRHCIDYIEQYGLSSEGLYRVPGVNSQIQSLVSALDRGEDFLQIPPTSASYYQSLETNKHSVGTRGTSGSESTSKTKDHPTRGSAPSPKRTRPLATDTRTPGPLTAQPQLPHDLAVICSVVKYFLRTLPEPVLTAGLGTVMESVPTEKRTIYEALARLVHQQLPRPHRFLLAWLLQHMVHIIDRAGENLMTQANIIIVLSPCLGISHRLLSILLGPAPPDVHIDLSAIDPSLPHIDRERTAVDPSMWHWLFPHPIYLLRPYRPPLRPGPDLELPETNEELELELRKQESLLYHLHEEIARGDTSAEKEAFLWEVQRLVTEIRRRKQLVDPDAIRAELIRQQAQLDRLHRAIAQNSSESNTGTGGHVTHTDGQSQPGSGATGTDSAPAHRRRLGSSAKTRTEPVSTSYSDELWEVQRQVTLLKRRLKQQEKLASSGHASTGSTGATTTTTTGAAAQNSAPRPDVIVQPPVGVGAGGVPLVIPSLSELDEEEVLNLTLRKLPLDAPTDVPPEARFPMPCSPVPFLSATPPRAPPEAVESPATTTVDLVPEKTLTAEDDSAPCPQPESTVQIENQAVPVEPIAVSSDQEVTTARICETPPLPPPPPPKHIVDATEQCHPELGSDLSSEPVKAVPPVESEAICVQPDKQPEPADSLHLSVPANAPEATTTVSNDSAGLDSTPLQGQSPVGKLEPVSRGVAYQVAMYEARKLELNAIQADLRARIRSEKAEICQIQSRINHLLDTGGSRVRRLYEAQFVPVDRNSLNPSSVPIDPAALDQPYDWLARSWTRIADRLNSDTSHLLSDERETCLMDDDDNDDDDDDDDTDDDDTDEGAEQPEDGSNYDGSSSDRSVNGPGNGSGHRSRKGHSVSYVRLVDLDEDSNLREDRTDSREDATVMKAPSTDITRSFQGVDVEPVRAAYTHLDIASDGAGVVVDVDNAVAEEEDDDDEDEDDDEENEAELARALHQLTLDNARLVQLNSRYLEGIQAERNRCAELKVLLKMRNARSVSVPYHLKETFTPVN